MVLLSRMEENVRCEGREQSLDCNEYPGTIWPRGHEFLRAFSTEPHPRWAYQGDGWTILKELRLIRGQNTVVLSYTLLGSGPSVDLEVRPLLALRGIHELSYQWNGKLEAAPRGNGHWHVPATRRTPESFFAHDGNFDRQSHWYLNQIYRRESQYGYAGLEDLWSPGAAHMRLMPGQTVHFACSADPFDFSNVIDMASRQVRGCDVVVAPANLPTDEDARVRDEEFVALCHATEGHVMTDDGDEALCVAAQYHWSPPSVRSALVGFAGLFLIPGRHALARSVLLSLVSRLKHGLLPTDFPTDASEPQPRGADVSLWFIHAVREYLRYTGDQQFVARHLLPAVMWIIEAYQHGTDRGIGMDSDGLLHCGDAQTATTWMENRADGQPLTPRHGRPVEINALWYNALMSAAELCRRAERPADADHLESVAARTHHSFNQRFWNAQEQCCFDVVGDGGNDAAVRPNQLLAVSLPFAVLRPDRWSAVVGKARTELLTPRGVRTLSPRDTRYTGRYTGDVARRDRAAHHGAAYPWLLGPYVTAMLRVTGRDASSRAAARKVLAASLERVRGDGLGHLNELCDGDAPHSPGGAIASPLAIAELLRSYAEDVLNLDATAVCPLPAATTTPGATSANTASRA
jgi:predicted glycogen debranching enzyme